MQPSPLTTIDGTFYRAIAADASTHILDGSRRVGRYSSERQSTLYMSASPAGVAAAMAKYRDAIAEPTVIHALDVRGAAVIDLRDEEGCRAVGIDPLWAAADWEPMVATGGSPMSWRVRQEAEKLGAHGLIDPSRKVPGLWHLALFRWNAPAAPVVKVLGIVPAP